MFLMKCFYFSNYRFYRAKAKTPLKFFLLSDIHFSAKVRQTTLNAIVKQAKLQMPNYILIAGDLLDSLDSIDAPANLKRLTAWLQRLGQVAPVLIALGNHDFYRKNPAHHNIFSTKRHWFAEEPAKLLEAIAPLDNVIVLNNSVCQDNQAYILGFTQTPEYFQFDRDDRATTFLTPGSEDKNILLYDLRHLNPKLLTKLPKNKVKIAIIHSPVFLSDPEVAEYFAEFDFIISGHMHNGVVPPVMIDFWRSDRGLMAPGKLFFPRHARTYITNPSEKSIICGPVSTIQASAKPITFMNGAFPVNLAMLELSNRETLEDRPDIKHQYINF